MSHHSDHDHAHDHQHGEETVSPLSEDEKLKKRIEHWIRHNTDHAKTYEEWAEKTGLAGLSEVQDLLQAAAKMTLSVNELFEKAAKVVEKRLA